MLLVLIIGLASLYCHRRQGIRTPQSSLNTANLTYGVLALLADERLAEFKASKKSGLTVLKNISGAVPVLCSITECWLLHHLHNRLPAQVSKQSNQPFPGTFCPVPPPLRYTPWKRVSVPLGFRDTRIPLGGEEGSSFID